MHRLRSVLRCLAEFRNSLEFALEKIPLHVECVVIERAAKVGRLDDEVMDDGPFLAGCVPKQPSATLHKLPGIGRAGQQEAHGEIRHVDPFIEAADGDDSIKEATGEIAEDFLPFGRAFPEGEVPDLEAMFLAKQS